jgi:hypothetical protein
MKPIFLSSIFLLLLCVTNHAADTAFFDSKVLPILKQRCFECHSHGTKIKGGLALIHALAGQRAETTVPPSSQAN